MITVGTLKGYNSLRALNAYCMLMIGLKLIPDNGHETFFDFLKKIGEMDLVQREKTFREAAMIVTVEEKEIMALISFCSDANGLPFGQHNLKNLGPMEFVDVIVAVCMEISKIKIDSVTEDQKKNSKTPQLT